MEEMKEYTQKYREILDIFAISEEESTSIEIQHSKLLDEIDYMKKQIRDLLD